MIAQTLEIATKTLEAQLRESTEILCIAKNVTVLKDISDQISEKCELLSQILELLGSTYRRVGDAEQVSRDVTALVRRSDSMFLPGRSLPSLIVLLQT